MINSGECALKILCLSRNFYQIFNCPAVRKLIFLRTAKRRIVGKFEENQNQVYKRLARLENSEAKQSRFIFSTNEPNRSNSAAQRFLRSCTFSPRINYRKLVHSVASLPFIPHEQGKLKLITKTETSYNDQLRFGNLTDEYGVLEPVSSIHFCFA